MTAEVPTGPVPTPEPSTEPAQPPASSVEEAARATALNLRQHAAENLAKALFRVAFVDPVQAAKSAAKADLPTLRLLAVKLTHRAIQKAAEPWLIKLGDLELAIYVVSAITKYHEGYGVALADSIKGENYHAHLMSELRQASQAPPPRPL